MKKKLLVLGASGLLGSNFIYFYRKFYNIYFNYYNNKLYFPNIKYCQVFSSPSEINYSHLSEKIEKISPDIILNCLAMTNVDMCEKNPKKSSLINYELPKILCQIAKKKKIKIVQISTDQLYSKVKENKTEFERTDPPNVYGSDKLKAENFIKKNYSDYLIIRTNFFGHSYFHKKITDGILNKLDNNSKIVLYSNYFHNPIYSKYLCFFINFLIKKNKNGIFNIVSNEKLSKYNFGLLLAKQCKKNIENIKSASVKVNSFFAKRNLDLSLSNKKFQRLYKKKIPSIKNQIKDFNNDKKKIENLFKKKFCYGTHYIDKKDINSVVNVLKSSNLTQGPTILKAELAVANYVGAKYAVAVSSATAGLHLAYLAIGVKKNHNIVTSPLTFVSTANAALFSQAKPYFVDINKTSLGMDLQQLETVIKNSRDIKTIVPVHFSGLASDSKEILGLSKKYNLRIVEDSAHGLGGTYACGSKIGSCKYSDLTVFSFHPVKIIASGEGGMITTNSKKLYNFLLEMRSHGINKNNLNFSNKKNAFTNRKPNPWYYEMNKLGFHYRQTDIHSGLILSQMKKINLFLTSRVNKCLKYDLFFKNNPYIELVQDKTRLLSSNHLYILRFKFSKLIINRLELMNKLIRYGIIAQVHYIPVPMQPFYSKLGYNMKYLKNCHEYYNECLSIPLYYQLTTQQQNYVQNSIKDIIMNNIKYRH